MSPSGSGPRASGSYGASGGFPAPDDGAGRRGALRAAFAGLTTRGRSFLAAGVAAAICAYVLGQSDLVRVGILLTALPLVCVLVLHRTRVRVAGFRQLAPGRVPAGSEARVHLRVENVSRTPAGPLMLEDRVPYVLGPRPRFTLDQVEPGGRREVSYQVRSDLRGRYQLGPLRLRLTDPFGMCELLRSCSAHDVLTVVPRAETLPPVRLSGEEAGLGDGRLLFQPGRRSLALAGDDDVIPRGYRHGDDLRRVHWRSTARHGELMVRREEQPQQARCTLLLDTRRTAYAGSGPGSPFEWAVSATASAALHLIQRGYAVRLVTDSGALTPGPDGGSFSGGSFSGGSFSGGAVSGSAPDAAGMLLDALADVEHSAESGLDGACEALRGDTAGPSGAGLLIGFFGDLEAEQATVVGRMRQHTSRAVAFFSTLQPPGPPADSGGGPVPGGGPAPADGPVPAGGEPPAGHRTLREAGWSVLVGGPGRSLAGLWQQADGATAEGLDR